MAGKVLLKHTHQVLTQPIFSLLLGLIIICSTSILLAQNPGLTNYSIREGLPSAEVYEVFQDSRGFIWFATDHGVVRFDGFEMQVLTVKDGLSDPVVFGFSEDEQQRIWFRTYSGKTSVYDNGKIHAYPWSSSLEEIIQYNLMYCLQSSGNKIYFSTERFLGEISKDGKIDKEEIQKYEVSVRITQDGHVLYGFNGNSTGVKRIKINDHYYPITLSDTLVHNKVLCGLKDGDSTLITINSDIFSFNGKEVKKVFTGRSSIISLSLDQKGFYWVGYSNNGVDKVDRKNFRVLESPAALSDKSVTKVLRDHEGGLWFSTLEEGVYYASNLEIKIIPLKDKTRAVAFNDNYAVIGDQQGFVSLFDLSGTRLVWEKKFPGSTRSIFIDHKLLWVSNRKTSTIDLLSGALINTYSASYTGFSAETDTSIMAVGGLRISRLYAHGEESKISNAIHLRLLVEGSKIYTSGRTGLEIYDTRLNLIGKPETLYNSKITSIIPFDHELIFVGTIGNGFHLLSKKDDHITSFNTENRFIANNIYYAQKKDTLIWVSTELGLMALNANSLKQNHLRIHRTISKEFQFERVNWFHVTNQDIWAVSDYNLKIIPAFQEVNKSNPIFYYEWIRPADPGNRQLMQLDYKSTLQLKFGFISFNNQNIYTRYRISSENEWTETTARIISLQSLLPGTYVLEIEYSMDNVYWQTGMRLPFTVLPPWWRTWAFFVIAGIFILIIGFFTFRRLVAGYKERNAYLGLINEQQKKLLEAEIVATERERSRIAKDLHDGIGMDLVSIKLMTNQLAKKTEHEDAMEIQNHLQKTISEIQNIIYGLTPSGLSLFGLSHGIDDFVTRIKKNHPIEIAFDYIGDEIKDQQTGTMIFRIVQELVTNSIKHSQGNFISIRIVHTASSIQIFYQDNGIGFDQNQFNPGLGLSNIRSRVESLSGHMKVDSSRSGTNYFIHIPLFK